MQTFNLCCGITLAWNLASTLRLKNVLRREHNTASIAPPKYNLAMTDFPIDTFTILVFIYGIGRYCKMLQSVKELEESIALGQENMCKY